MICRSAFMASVSPTYSFSFYVPTLCCYLHLGIFSLPLCSSILCFINKMLTEGKTGFQFFFIFCSPSAPDSWQRFPESELPFAKPFLSWVHKESGSQFFRSLWPTYSTMACLGQVINPCASLSNMEPGLWKLKVNAWELHRWVLQGLSAARMDEIDLLMSYSGLRIFQHCSASH